MEVREYENRPVLIIDDELDAETARGRALRDLVEELVDLDLEVIQALSYEDGASIIRSDASISCVLLDYNLAPLKLLKKVRERNKRIPVFLIAEKLEVKDIPTEVVEQINGYSWLMEDTPDFIAGRIEESVKEYISELLPPFFKELVEYTYEYKYAWHTPGHMGGIAFRKSPAGRYFYDFFGENTLRSDLSVSVPELGSLLEHSGVVGEAESQAAKAFGADQTYFVTNGTSTANKIVFHGTVTPGDVVVADRNCHKSVMHAIIMTGAIPVYFIPTRNKYGIIGPIHNKEFKPSVIRKKIKESPLIKDKKAKPRLAVVTNSTYDGLCYHVGEIKQMLKGQVENIHFDEAWYAYAAFHPMYTGRFGMHEQKNNSQLPNVFATQSTHKCLAAFSQASMVHVKSGKERVDPERFNEAYMMHTSTSPQYGIIASLDVAARMMEEGNGKVLVDEAIEEAVMFRKKMVQISKSMRKKKGAKAWWFPVWQPDTAGAKQFDAMPDEKLRENPDYWTLKPGKKWHGFGDLSKEHVLLDPIKVTILMPGVTEKGMGSWGIPAGIVSRFLRNEGIVAEKTGHYSFLMLFTIGGTRGKSGTLLSKLFKFKELYDSNAPLEEVFPDLVKENPGAYAGMKLQQLCKKMHDYLKKVKITEIVQDVYAKMPEQSMTPAESYKRLVRGKVKKVSVKQLNNKVSAAMVVPYPPGIPVIMPGEKFTSKTKKIMDYLGICEDFDNAFPGFENEVHGVMIEPEDGKNKYYVYCIA